MASSNGGYYAAKDVSQRSVLCASNWLAAPIQQITPTQQWFIDNAQGRWAADAVIGAHAPVNQLRVRQDGTCDYVALSPQGDAYVDLGGQGGVDVAAGRL